MRFAPKLIGTIVPASLLFAAGYGVIAASATAQDEAAIEAQAPAALLEEAPVAEEGEAIRFTASSVVQEIPEIESQSQSEDSALAYVAVEASSLRELVSLTDASAAMSHEMDCLSKAVYFESRGEPLAGQLAVARVIINRTASSQFPNDYCGVVTQRAQFSFVRGGRIPQPKMSSAAWSRAKAIAQIAHRDIWESEAADSLYFHARHVSPSWARRKQARATIDSHIFYR